MSKTQAPQTQAVKKLPPSGRKWRDVFVALYVATQQDNKSERERIQAERTMQRALEEVERLISPRPTVRFHNPNAREEGVACSCALCYILREYERHARAMTGRQTTSYGEAHTLNDGNGHEVQTLAATPRGGTRQSPIDSAIDTLTRIESLLEATAHRGDVRKILERHGLGHNLTFETCSICDDPRRREIDTLLLVDCKSLRDVEDWTEQTGTRYSRETLRKHAKHQRGQ